MPTFMDNNSPADLYKHVRLCSLGDIELDFSAVTDDQWRSVVEFCRFNSVFGDFAFHIQNLTLFNQLPKDVLQTVHAAIWSSERTTELLRNDLTRLIDVFRSSGIPYVLLKGTSLIVSGVYQTAGQRAFNDIDIAIHPKDMDSVHSQLLSSGFTQELKLKEPVSEYWCSKHLPPYSHEKSNFKVELHIRPFEDTWMHKAPYDSEALLADARKVTWQGADYWVPSERHSLVGTFYHSEIFDGWYLVGKKNYRALSDADYLVRMDQQSFNLYSMASELLTSRLRHIFSLFTYLVFESLQSHSSNTKPQIKTPELSKSFYQVRKKLRFALSPIAVFIVQSRTVKLANSKHGRQERAAILSANNNAWKYQPVWRQIVNPAALSNRLGYLIKRVRLNGSGGEK